MHDRVALCRPQGWSQPLATASSAIGAALYSIIIQLVGTAVVERIWKLWRIPEKVLISHTRYCSKVMVNSLRRTEA